MTGIERLRKLSGDLIHRRLWVVLAEGTEEDWGCFQSDGRTVNDELLSIADQIERESDVETVRSDAMEALRWVRKRGGLATLQLHEETFMDMMRQRDEYRAIARDYERDATWVREHGGLEVVREQLDLWEDVFGWAVELGGVDTCREAAEWVREHGGLEEVRRMFQDADNRRVELCAALGIGLDTGWSDAMASMRLRLMPEGMEWPRFEDGEPVRFGDAIADELGHAHEVSSVEVFDDAEALHWNPSEPEEFVWLVHGEPVRRPALKVLDADGVEIHVGDTVWATNGHGPFEVTRTVYADRLRVICDDEKNGHLNVFPESITHRAPALAADGRPLREGETVWKVKNGDGPYHVQEIRDGVSVCVEETSCEFMPKELTHERPDSWERLEEDVAGASCPDVYCANHHIDASDTSYEWAMARDIVRRARALAERGK